MKCAEKEQDKEKPMAVRNGNIMAARGIDYVSVSSESDTDLFLAVADAIRTVWTASLEAASPKLTCGSRLVQEAWTRWYEVAVSILRQYADEALDTNGERRDHHRTRTTLKTREPTKMSRPTMATLCLSTWPSCTQQQRCSSI